MRTHVGLVIAAALGTAGVVAAGRVEPQFPGRGAGMFRPSAFAALDADGNGTVSAVELAKAPTALLTLDRNHDGALSADELAPVPGRGGRRGPGAAGREGRGGRTERDREEDGSAPEELADTLMAFDRNADGKLERTEVPERFQGLFDRADGNRDGVLTREELRVSAESNETERGSGRRGGEGRAALRDRAFAALDTNLDSTVSAAEIEKAADALRALDTNGDGEISAAEWLPLPPNRGGRGGRGFGVPR